MHYIKTTVVVTGLLLIGFVSGFYTHRYLTTKKIREVAELRMAGGFQSHLFNTIRASDEQKEILRPIVEKYAGKIAANHQIFRENRQTIIDSLLAELKPFLSETQQQQLGEFNRPFRGRKPNADRKEYRDERERGGKSREE